MDGSQFDRMTREFATATSRRTLLRRSLVAAVGLVPALGARSADAAVKRGPGEICRKGADCASGVCSAKDRTGRQTCLCGSIAHCPQTGTGPCKSAICTSGVCGYTVNTGQPCDDGNACTENTVCSAKGVCAGSVVVCQGDDDPCTVTECNPKTGCVTRPFSAAEMDDGNACTVDSCDPARGIIHEPIICPPPSTRCVIAYCDPDIGCTEKPRNCDDGNACTVDTCDEYSGTCVNLPIDCADGDPCTIDTCDKTTGCVHTPKVCDDNNVCTTDTCDSTTGNCIYTPITEAEAIELGVQGICIG